LIKNRACQFACNDLLAWPGGSKNLLLQDYFTPNLAKQTVSNPKTPPPDGGMVPWLLAKSTSLLGSFASETNLN